MANNRMHLKCGICGKQSPSFAKYYPSTFWQLRNKEQMDIWFENHWDCGSDKILALVGPTHFELVYEHDQEM